jgi:hypothetical protein
MLMPFDRSARIGSGRGAQELLALSILDEPRAPDADDAVGVVHGDHVASSLKVGEA